MKLLSIILFFSLPCLAQNKDSIQLAEQQKQIKEIVTKTSVNELNEFLYKTMTAEKYAEFIKYYQEFIRQKFAKTSK